MPVNDRWPIDELLKACAAYTRATKRIITFEYTVIAGVRRMSREEPPTLAVIDPAHPGEHGSPFSFLTEEQYARWSVRRDGRHNFQLRPEAEFNLDNIPEEYREQFLERMRQGGYHEQPPTTPPGAPGAPFVPQQ